MTRTRTALSALATVTGAAALWTARLPPSRATRRSPAHSRFESNCLTDTAFRRIGTQRTSM